MIHEFKYPVPVICELGEGYVWYVRDGGHFENDIFCIVMCNGGVVKYLRADQFTIANNGTFDIKNKNETKE